jgi:FkbM family methyltransferase
LGAAARAVPSLRRYQAKLASGDHLYVDLREKMCMPYFFDGCLPHERGTESLCRKVLHEGAVFVDIGANVGYFTRLAGTLVGPSGRVFAFEPMPRAYWLLQLNTKRFSNTRLFQAAVSDQPGEQTFYVRSSGDLSSLDPGPDAVAVRVAVTTLDNTLSGLERLDLIKIDVEGFEPEVLRGGREVIASRRPLVCFEYLPTFAEKRGFGIESLRSFFAGLRYRVRWLNHSQDDRPLVGDTVSTYAVGIPEERA